MDSMEFNKIAGATIGALLLFLLLNFFSGQIYGTRVGAHPPAGEGEGPLLAYAVPVEAVEGAGEAEEPQVDLLALFQHPDIAAGEAAFRACGACHSVEPGENKVGPSLFDVVGRDIATVEGFAYSDAMLAHEGDWRPELMFAFLENPKAVVPGTKMSYAGMDDPEDRANLIAYLNEIGDTPVELTEGIEPLATEAEAAAEAETEVAEASGSGAVIDEPGQTVEGSPGDTVEGGTVTDTAPPVVTPESITESTTSSLPPAQPETTVTDVEIVDVGEEDVEVETTTPLEVERAAPAPAGSGETGPAEQSVTAESPAEEHLTAEGPSDAPVPPEGEDVTIEPDAAAPVPAGEGNTELAAASLGGDPEAGEKIFRRCQACHRLEEGQNAIGPSLYGVVGRDIASVEDFEYSDALAAHEGVWTPEMLSQFLTDPRKAIPGNKMAFAGLKDEQDRIDVITFLQQAAQ